MTEGPWQSFAFLVSIAPMVRHHPLADTLGQRLAKGPVISSVLQLHTEMSRMSRDAAALNTAVSMCLF